MNKVSIIIPVYNAELYLKRCIDSCINQTYKNIEIILINDGSKDNSEKIIKTYQDERIVYIHKENSGVSATRNIGLKIATGKYIMFADADDWYELDAVEQMVNAIEKENCDAIRSNYNRVIQSQCYKNSEKIQNNKIIEMDDVISGRINCYVWLIIINKNALKKAEFDTDLPMMEDTLFFIELLSKGIKIKYKNIITYNYYFNSESASINSKNLLRNMMSIFNVYEKIICKELKVNKEKLKLTIIRDVEDIIKDLFKYDRVQFKKAYNMIISNVDYRKILKNVPYKKLNITYKVMTYCLEKEQYNLLTIFLFIRSKLSKVKRMKHL